jgi:hypothetical protein
VDRRLRRLVIPIIIGFTVLGILLLASYLFAVYYLSIMPKPTVTPINSTVVVVVYNGTTTTITIQPLNITG